MGGDNSGGSRFPLLGDRADIVVLLPSSSVLVSMLSFITTHTTEEDRIEQEQLSNTGDW